MANKSDKSGTGEKKTQFFGQWKIKNRILKTELWYVHNFVDSVIQSQRKNMKIECAFGWAGSKKKKQPQNNDSYNGWMCVVPVVSAMLLFFVSFLISSILIFLTLWIIHFVSRSISIIAFIYSCRTEKWSEREKPITKTNGKEMKWGTWFSLEHIPRFVFT